MKILRSLKYPVIEILSSDRYVCPLNALIKLYKSILKLFHIPYCTCEHGNLTKNGLFSSLVLGDSITLLFVYNNHIITLLRSLIVN